MLLASEGRERPDELLIGFSTHAQTLVHGNIQFQTDAEPSSCIVDVHGATVKN